MAGSLTLVKRNSGMTDFFKWNRFSSLQRLITVAIVIFVISCIFSLWTLFIMLALAIMAGIKSSSHLLNKGQAAAFAEAAVYEFELIYSGIKSLLVVNGTPTPQSENVNTATLQPRSGLATPMDVSSTKTSIRSEINSLQLLIMRDFIRSWYSTFSYDSEFLKECKSLLQYATNNLMNNVSNQKPNILINQVLRLYCLHVSMYIKAKSSYSSHLIHPNTSVPKDTKLKRHTSVDDAFGQVFKFHIAVESDESEENYLRGVTSIILLSLCPSHIIEGQCSRTLLVEILTYNLSLPLFHMMSDPDWLMEKIIEITSNIESTQSKMTGDDENDECNFSISKFCDERSDSMLVNTTRSCSVHNVLTVTKDGEANLYAGITHQLNTASSLKVNKENGNTSVEHNATFGVEVYRKASTTDDADSVLESFPFSSSSDTQGDTKSQHLVFDNHISTLQQNHCSINSEYRDVTDSVSTETEDDNDSLKTNEDEKDLNQDPSESHSVSSMEVASSLTSEISKEDNTCVVLNSKLASINGIEVEDEQNYSEGGSTDEVPSENLDDIKCDPQKILSYDRSSSSSMFYSESSSPEISSSSFPKFSSLKNFIVDSLKPNKSTSVAKPTTLSLFSDKISSNLPSLPSKMSTKSSNSNDKTSTDQAHKKPPQVLLDGQPIDSSSENAVNDPVSPSVFEDIETPQSDSEITSPGFFSSIRPFFSMSSSHSDHNIASCIEINEESSAFTPSPTAQTSITDCIEDPLKQRGMSKSFIVDDRRIFQDVCIQSTTTSHEYRSTTQYSLYVIEYEAMYFTEEGKSILRSGTVKRRYREFTNLQSRLEGYPAYKKFLKSIRGPRRWPSLPFKGVDKATVETRRTFLEKYLKDLIEIEAICNGPDLREFLAYEGDSHIAFVKKSPDITVPRIDKMFMRGVSGVVDRIRALPSIPQGVIQGFRGRETSEDKLNKNRALHDSDMIDIQTVFPKQIEGNGLSFCDITKELIKDLDLDLSGEKDIFHFSNVIRDLKSHNQILETYEQEIDKVQSVLKGMQGQGTEQPSSSDSTSADVDLSTAVLDLLAIGLQSQGHWICKDNVMKSLTAVVGKALNSYLKTSIASLTSEEEITSYLQLLREAVWPQGQLFSESRPVKTDEEKMATRRQAKESLINFFPGLVRTAVGKQEFESCIEVFLNSLECEKLNRHFWYETLELLLNQLFPEAKERDLLRALLFTRSNQDGYL